MLTLLRVLLLGLVLGLPALPVFAAPPAILLAEVYRNQVDLTQYLVSEKLDGVRAIWDGQILRFRSGKPIHAPGWFTAGLPRQPLDGELWMGWGILNAFPVSFAAKCRMTTNGGKCAT